MDAILQQIEAYKNEIEGAQLSNPQQLEEYRIRFLGTKGIVKGLFGEIKNIPGDKRKEFGLVLNDFKQFAENKYEAGKSAAAPAAAEVADELDLSLPGNNKGRVVYCSLL